MGRDFDPDMMDKICQESMIDEEMKTKFGIKSLEEEKMPPDLMVQFHVMMGTDKGATFVVEELPIFIGREKEAVVPLSDSKVSRKHAIIVYKNHRFFVIDLGSTNGTFVNGKKVEGVPLRSGDMIQFGDSVLSFEVKKR